MSLLKSKPFLTPSHKVYQRRRPEQTPLYQAIEQHLPHLKERLYHEGKTLPQFVHRTFESYLNCGRLKNGFARLYCKNCQHNRLVAFSCKKRGLCPSCMGRMMTQRAQRQREEVLPAVTTRQWVLTFPNPLHVYLAYFPRALTEALELFIETLRYHYQRQCLPQSKTPPKRYDIDYLQTFYRPYHPHDIGTMTSIQRHTDALGLYPHFHTLCTDGLLVSADENIEESALPRRQEQTAMFIPSPQLSQMDLYDILILYKYRLTRHFIRRGYLRPIHQGVAPEEQQFNLYWGTEPPTEEEQQLLKCYAASKNLRHAFGPKAGEPLELDLDDQTVHSHYNAELCATYYGFNLHADTVVQAEDRDRLEQLCRYIQRPVIAQDRLQELSDGRYYYGFKRIWKNGTKGIYFEGPDLLERLAALVPPPKKHQLRYHGVFAPRSRLFQAVRKMTHKSEQRFKEQKKQRRKRYWILWIELLKRSFQVDVACCPICNQSMQRIAELHTPEGIMGLTSYDEHARPPP